MFPCNFPCCFRRNWQLSGLCAVQSSLLPRLTKRTLHKNQVHSVLDVNLLLWRLNIVFVVEVVVFEFFKGVLADP